MYIVYIKYLTPHYTLCIQYAMEDLFEVLCNVPWRDVN